MLFIVCLTEDIVPPVFDSDGIVVPIGALIEGLVVYVDPDFGGRRNQDLRRHPRNWT